MSPIATLLDEVMEKAAGRFYLQPAILTVEGQDCHGCGEASPDVEVYAEDPETGEQLWFCPACGDW